VTRDRLANVTSEFIGGLPLPPFFDFNVIYNAAIGRSSKLNSLHKDFDEFLTHKIFSFMV
jgi:hypothetical protein